MRFLTACVMALAAAWVAFAPTGQEGMAALLLALTAAWRLERIDGLANPLGNDSGEPGDRQGDGKDLPGRGNLTPEGDPHF